MEGHVDFSVKGKMRNLRLCVVRNCRHCLRLNVRKAPVLYIADDGILRFHLGPGVHLFQNRYLRSFFKLLHDRALDSS